MERPARKKIRLEGWNYSGAATYFLTLCTKGRKPLLSRVVGCGILDAPQLQLSEYGTCVQEALMYLENQQKEYAISYQRYHAESCSHFVDTLRNGWCVPRRVKDAAPYQSGDSNVCFVVKTLYKSKDWGGFVAKKLP